MSVNYTKILYYEGFVEAYCIMPSKEIADLIWLCLPAMNHELLQLSSKILKHIFAIPRTIQINWSELSFPPKRVVGKFV